MILPNIQEDFVISNLHSKITLLLYSIANLIGTNDDRFKVCPKELLMEAVHSNREIGSSTCVLATLDEKEPLLYTANMGDSGYLLLRKEGLDLIA